MGWSRDVTRAPFKALEPSVPVTAHEQVEQPVLQTWHAVLTATAYTHVLPKHSYLHNFNSNKFIFKGKCSVLLP